MLQNSSDPSNGPEPLERLTAHLRNHGPATAQDIVGILNLSRAGTYGLIREALNRGLVRAVAHVHSDDNHQPRAWDIDSPDGELLWRRRERWVRGRFCTCFRRGSAAREAD